MNNYFQQFTFLSVLVLLTACGGGGGGSASDVEAPVIDLNGDSVITIIQGRSYADPATATDNVDGNVALVISGTLNTDFVARYTRTYTATDAAGNQATATRTINVREALPFITTWRTDNDGESEDNQIMILTTTTDQNYTVDWGDSSQDTGVTGGITHTYDNEGTYTISISGDFRNIKFTWGGDDSAKLLTIEQWGDTQWTTMDHAFYTCRLLNVKATDIPDLSNVTSTSHMFWDLKTFSGDLSQWDVSSVTDMSYMFAASESFNGDISAWDVSSVTNMSAMFDGSDSFNQDLSQWDVASVIDMSFMFDGAIAFNADISLWDVSSVENMKYMFSEATVFNADISQWDVSSVENMTAMFEEAAAFNADISRWDVSSVTNMASMFSDATAFNSTISQWDVSSVSNMSAMFENSDFAGDISLWDVSSVTNMTNMFNGVTLNTNVYSGLLQGWSSQSLKSYVTFTAGSSKYSPLAQAARDALINNYNWTITDWGVESL